MKRIIHLLIYLLIFAIPTCSTFASELQGGVVYDVNSAREYVNEGLVGNIDISGSSHFVDDNKVQKVVYSRNNSGEIVGITVQYKNEPDKAYIYSKDYNLIYVDKYDKPVDVYPHRGYRYNLNGNLTLTSLTVSKSEQFRFSPDGELIAHAVKGIIYDEGGNVIGKANW